MRIMARSNFWSVKLIISFLSIPLFFGSCVSLHQIEYLQVQKQKQEIVPEYKNETFQDYILKPNDELYIQISSLDEAAANISSSAGNQNLGNLNAYGASLMAHTIDKEGYLELPVIGKINAKNKTIAELTLLIKESLSNVLNQPWVAVKLVNRYISVLGEVRSPGHIVYSQEKLTVFDAIGLAGDITDYGNRKKVILIRNDENKNTRIEINLLNSNFLSSQYYFLRPGDILYVKPLQKRFWGIKEFPFAILLSSISTTILVLNYYQK